MVTAAETASVSVLWFWHQHKQHLRLLQKYPVALAAPETASTSPVRGPQAVAKQKQHMEALREHSVAGSSRSEDLEQWQEPQR